MSGDRPNGGRLDGGGHVLPVRVYWEDTDAGGIVYHASYIRFMERGRTEFLRAVGLDQSAMQMLPNPVLIVVRRMTVDYLKPAKLDDALTVETRITAMSGVRVEMAQRVRRGETVLVTAEVMAATIGGDGRPCRMPDAMRALFAPLVSDPSVGL
jgi:acyl-CoA thioester hydrolase